MTAQTVITPLFWLLNGFLAVLYLLAEHWQSVLLAPTLAWLCLRGPKEHRSWALGISVLALSISLLAPQPIPILLLVMAMAAVIALYMEKFNPASLHWRTISGIALYSLAGAGIFGFQFYLDNAAVTSPLVAQGQAYIGILAAIGLYGLPLAFLAMLAQGMLVHPPIPGSGRPGELINTLRARGQD